MQAFELSNLIVEQQAGSGPWLEFLRVPGLSMGLYVLPADGTDLQQPHTEDEVYFVTEGRAILQVDGADQPVQAGSIVYVAANAAHHFHSIAEELRVLVFFAPAEYTKKT